MDILHGLNEQQRCAVTSIAPVLQVLAPPGSGKTKTLTARVAYLIAHHGLQPGNMIVCTFTIKAAREMKERIRHFIGDELESRLVLGTFHSVARRYLMIYGEHINIPKNFGIADSSDSLSIIKRLTKRHGYTLEPAKARSRISRHKSTSRPKVKPTKIDIEQQEFEDLFGKYENTLRESNLLDYDDLLLRCVELLQRYPECVNNVQAVLIDEFQDTNTVQYELMRLFPQQNLSKSNSKKNTSITIVGDPDQSIYSFRSAEIENLNKMTREYPDTHVVILEDNYRSSGSILTSALEVIEQDSSRPAKRMMSTHCPGEMPVLRKLPSSGIEAFWIVLEIQRLVKMTKNLINYSDFAVLLRTASLSRQIEAALGKAGIPYRMVGGSKFFDRIEVRILLDYLRVVSQPNHTDAVVRTINVPSRKIGETTVKALLEEAEGKHWTLWKLVLSMARGQYRPMCKISTQAQKGIDAFVNVVLTTQEKLAAPQSANITIVDLLQHIMQKLSFESHIRQTYPEEFENRWDNVQELFIQASAASAGTMNGMDLESDSLVAVEGISQQDYSSAEGSLTRFLANVALSSEVEKGSDGEAVQQLTISTIHAAKGLEWPVVFIPAVYQGSIPHSRAEDTDEERRLLYVGMTRAQSLLYLSWPKKSSAGEETKPSPFVSERRMSRFFAYHGSPMTFSVAQDIARILGRVCPSPSELQEAATTVERTEDDGWLDEDESHQSASFNGFAADSGYSYSKRQKVSHSSAGGEFLGTSELVGKSSYSITNTTIPTGFITASTRKQELDVLEKNARVDALTNEVNRLDSKPTAQKSSNKRPQQGQGSILSFFAKPAQQMSNSQPVSKNVDAATRNCDLQRCISLAEPLSRIPNPNTTTRPPPPISSNFTSHKLRVMPSASRPRPVSREENGTPKRYILLSSSPTKPEDDAQVRGDSKDLQEPDDKLETARPASTLHTTTMMMQRQGPQRRTLGVRRSMVSWSAAQAQRSSNAGK